MVLAIGLGATAAAQTGMFCGGGGSLSQKAQPGVLAQYAQHALAEEVLCPGYGGEPTSKPWMDAPRWKPPGQLPDSGQQAAEVL